MSIEIYDTRTMLEALYQLPPVRTFLLDTFFTEAPPHDTESVDIDVVKGGRKMAPFVSPLKEGKVVEGRGFSSYTFNPPYIKPKRVLTPKDVVKRLPGEVLYTSSRSPQDRQAVKVGEFLADMDEAITRRIEWMAAQALLSGKVECVGEGVSAVVDFQRDPGQTVVVSAADKWTADTSDPIGQVFDWKQQTALASGHVPDTAVVGAGVAKAMRKNKAILEALDNRRVDIGYIKPETLPNGATYIGRFEEIDWYTYSEVYVDEETDDLIPLMPDDLVLLGTRRSRAVVHYGVIMDLEATAALARYPKMWLVKDPSTANVMLQSAPLPVPHEPDAFLVAKVI
ncbi:major capsid protein [Desulfovibrio inopinatus]|uniref:major capsid protein n=1 Tax=Desulfovibrio inopinatus TaxID=102109 RepID=UPI00040BD2EA|nr:major capsid protein [Desulfovibrio inopinatus]